MARRRRRRSAATTKTRRRRSTTTRRRRAVTLLANPAKRRRRRRSTAVAAVASRRRRRSTRRKYTRNPSLGGIQRTVVEGIKDGATVFVAQVATRKAAAGINGMVPASIGATSPAVRGILTRMIGAIAVTMAARKMAPARARLAAAGAFAEVVNFAVAQNPTASKFLSAFPSRRVLARPANGNGRVGAWTQGAVSGGRNMAAYPMRSVGLPVGVGM